MTDSNIININIYSRFACCRAMTNRKNETILEEIKSIFDEMGLPKAINSDNEFNKAILNDYFEPDEINKNAIVERCNRTLCGYGKIQLVCMVKRYR